MTLTPAAPPSASGGRARHWMVVAGSACLMVAGQFVFLSSSILNPPMARDLGVGLGEIMVFNSLMAISGVFAMMFGAPLAFRRFGVRASLVAGGVWMGVSLAAVSLVQELPLLYALGFSAGLTMGISTSMAASMLVNTWFEARRGTVMGAVFALSGAGGIAAGLVLPPLVAGVGWRAGYLVIAGVIAALVVLPGLLLIRSTPERVGLRPFGALPPATTADGLGVQLPGVPARQAFRTPQFFALAGAIALFAMVMAFQQHFVGVMTERGVTTAVAGSLLSLMALASVGTNLALGTLNDRRGTRAAVLVAMVCQAGAMIAYVFSSGFVPLAASTALFAIGAAFPGVLIPILVMQVFGMRDYPSILGPTMAMLPAGMAFGAPLWGAALDRTGSYTVALVAATVVTGVVAVLIVWALRSGQELRARVERELGQSYGTADTAG